MHIGSFKSIKFVLLLGVVALHASGQSEESERSEKPDLKQLQWLQGTWKGVGYERTDIDGSQRRPIGRQRDFKISFDETTSELSFSGSRKMSINLNAWNDWYHYDPRNKELTLNVGSGDSEMKRFIERVTIQYVDEGFIVFYITYERRSASEAFVAQGSLVRLK